MNSEFENVEMFLPTGSHLGGENRSGKDGSIDQESHLRPYLIVPQGPKMPLSKKEEALKNWRKIKMCMKVTSRRTSLMEHEEAFLQAIKQIKRGRPQKRVTSASLKLNSELLNKTNKLTQAEQSFLSSLLNLPNISEEQLEKVNDVLTSDPLYHSEAGDEEEEKKNTEESIPSLVTKHRKSTTCTYRDELWKFHTISTRSDKNTMKYETKKKMEPETDEKEEDPKKTEEEKVRKGRASFPNFFSSSSPFSLFKVEEKKEEQSKESHEEVSESFCILGTLGASDKNCRPHVLSPPIMDALRPHMPYAYQEDNYWLKFSMVRDGAHMRALLKHVRNSSRSILAIETTDGDIFGAFTSTPWRPQGRTYYGSCEAFVWRLKKSRYSDIIQTVEEQSNLESQIEVFKWSQKNRNIQSLANPDSSLVVGGGGIDNSSQKLDSDVGSALILDTCLERGTSEKCLTFDSPVLITNNENDDDNNDIPTDSKDMRKKSGIFEIINVEVWTMTPVEDITEAEQLEYGRHFVFDHSHFKEA